MPEKLSRGANGCMPACELADVLAKVMERWWRGDEAGARDLYRRLFLMILRIHSMALVLDCPIEFCQI